MRHELGEKPGLGRPIGIGREEAVDEEIEPRPDIGPARPDTVDAAGIAVLGGKDRVADQEVVKDRHGPEDEGEPDEGQDGVADRCEQVLAHPGDDAEAELSGAGRAGTISSRT